MPPAADIRLSFGALFIGCAISIAYVVHTDLLGFATEANND